MIGALFVGVDVDKEIQSVEDGIHALKIGASGYYFVVDASSGADRERGGILAAQHDVDRNAAPA